MSSVVSSPGKGKIVTKNNRRAHTIAPAGHGHQKALSKVSVGSNKSAPRMRTTKTTDPKLAARKKKESESQNDPSLKPEVVEARKKLQRIIGMVRSLVRFTGAKKENDASSSASAPVGFRRSIENTYKVEPERRFRPPYIAKTVRRTIAPMIEHYTYDSAKASSYSRALAASVIETCKHLKLDRYRFVVNVVIGGGDGQSVGMSSRCLWDENYDNSLTLNFQGKDCFIVITVHAMYMD